MLKDRYSGPRSQRFMLNTELETTNANQACQEFFFFFFSALEELRFCLYQSSRETLGVSNENWCNHKKSGGISFVMHLLCSGEWNVLGNISKSTHKCFQTYLPDRQFQVALCSEPQETQVSSLTAHFFDVSSLAVTNLLQDGAQAMSDVRIWPPVMVKVQSCMNTLRYTRDLSV